MICDIIIITSQSALAQQDDGLRAPAYRPALSVFLSPTRKYALSLLAGSSVISIV